MPNFIFEKRSYQEKSVSEVLEHFSKGRNSVLLESPVGSGKTVMGLLVIKALQEQQPDLRVNWVAARRHILTQTQQTNDAMFNCNISYVSVFSKNPPKADFVILDEAHHEATQSCLDMYEATGNTRTLGLSATPLRTDKMRLSFQSNVHNCDIQQLINLNILSQIHSYKIPRWEVEQVANVFCERAQFWGKSLVFFHTLAECFIFKKIVDAQGISCSVISSNSNKDAELEAFVSGDIQVVANVSVLCEGFDLPELRTVFIRDASRLPTIQMAGRGLRGDKEKEYCNLIQSTATRYPIERITAPAENFRYKKGQWLSCSGDTQAIRDKLKQSKQLLLKRQIKLPRYIKDGTHKRYVSIDGVQ